MTDRELLEMAAKAAEIDIQGWDGNCAVISDPYTRLWNPLHNDGDALRLSVTLQITIQWSITVDDFSPSVEVYHAEDVHSECVEVKTGDDPYAATRRAIVRAAAEIGKGMK